MSSDFFFCLLLREDIGNPLCLRITYGAEGRLGQGELPDVTDWELAKDICADCTNAYWNKNNMEPPEWARENDE